MKDFHLTKHNLQKLMADLQYELEDSPILVINSQNPNTGKWGLAKLWRMWMKTTGDYMASNGCKMPLMLKGNGEQYGARPFNEQDAHELFTNKWLGSDRDGCRLSWARKGHDGMRAATKGERFGALRSHEEWCVEKGIILFKPRDSEYTQIENECNE